MNDLVVLVDEKDNEIGTREKLSAHLSGELHRAISVFIFNSEKKMLLQRRALNKYHSGGLWTNACCSHPHPGETTMNAAKRRLREEMGMKEEMLKYVFNFTYKAFLDNDLIEHELDHVFIGKTDDIPVPNTDEVNEWKYISVSELEEDLKENPAVYTHWFKLIFERLKTEAEKEGFI